MKIILLVLIAASAFCQTVKVAPWYSAGAGAAQLTTTAATDTSLDWIAAGRRIEIAGIVLARITAADAAHNELRLVVVVVDRAAHFDHVVAVE